MASRAKSQQSGLTLRLSSSKQNHNNNHMADKTFEEILKLAKGVAEKLSEEDEEKKVLKKIKVKPEWQKALKKMTDATEEGKKQAEIMNDIMNKHKTLRRAFWAKVEEDLGLFSNSMTLSDDNKEITIYEKGSVCD